MSYCKSQSCINNEKIFIDKFNKIIDDDYNIIQELFNCINALPFSARTITNGFKIKVFIIRFFNKIYEDYKDNFYKLTQYQKNYYREPINDKWGKKFNLMIKKTLEELEDSEANIYEINDIVNKVNCLYSAFRKHTIYHI